MSENVKHMSTVKECYIGNFVINNDPVYHQLKEQRKLQLNILPYKLTPPSKYFKGRLIELDYLRRSLNQTHIIVITGIGGIGKSELAKKYAEENNTIYQNNIVWIDAESIESVCNSFQLLAQNLFEIEDINTANLLCIVRNVYEYFKTKTLFIFDNFVDKDNLYQFLPYKEHKNIYTLITAQFEDWKDLCNRKLSGVNEDEAIMLFKSIMDDKYDTERDEENWKELADILGYVPLALQMSAVYVYDETNEFNPDYTVKDYIKKLEENAGILYKYEMKNYPKSLLSSFDLVLKKITVSEVELKSTRRYTNKNLKAIDILNLCAHLNPCYITKDTIFKLLKYVDESIVINYLHLISKYSLISSDGKKIYMNNLFQQILRYQQEVSNQIKNYYYKILKLIIEDEEMFYHRRYAMKYAERNVEIAAQFYNETKSSNFLKILAQYGCHLTLTEIFKYMSVSCYTSKRKINAKIKKHVLLYDAVLSADLTTVQLMLNYSKDVNVKNEYGWTPLKAAIESKNVEIQVILLENGASDQQNKDGVTQLHESLRDGYMTMARFLVENKAGVNIQDNDGNISLHYAVKNKAAYSSTPEYLAIVSLLIANTENINCENKLKLTPLHYAAMYGKASLTKLLLENGANINIANANGVTPLLVAILNKQLKTVILIVENDKEGSVNKINKEGRTPLHYAAKLGYEEIAEYLTTKMETIIVKDKDGNTPIHFAVLFKQTSVLRILVKTVININVKNRKGSTPLMLAKEIHNNDAVKFLTDCRNRQTFA